MSIFRPLILAGALAGLIVGLVLSGAQQIGTVPLILQAETYEQGGDEDHAWQPAEGFERNAFTALFNVVEWIGFGFLLGGGLVLSRRQIGWREGFLWGLAGFLTFVIAPGLGLPPELPGIPAAPLEPRQIWWIGTAAATAAGLGLIVFQRKPWAAALAIALIAAPHLIGAPHLDKIETEVPELLAHRFLVAVTLCGLLAWSLLGGLTGYFYGRFEKADG
jgi:cobalt transporter subunit CbtA